MLNLYVKLATAFSSYGRKEDGATAIEYGLFAALIAAVLVGVVGVLGTEVQGIFQDVCDALKKEVCSLGTSET
ncbi:Flp family type IVb pilin [Celeribacter indicus]|uniref:Pilin protein n=1 Tax=Celeribacter indicus TaxID=1208324 RepID=A0A0B5DZF1_9RHOB|nr:Flp family type IVb pilin [Celeribacter indicus]AJE48833.1 pilin protein [Celeribacter indicus]SDW38640.1 pilus assembly protein Flp/PilA [Celeribacter indicus]